MHKAGLFKLWPTVHVGMLARNADSYTTPDYGISISGTKPGELQLEEQTIESLGTLGFKDRCLKIYIEFLPPKKDTKYLTCNPGINRLSFSTTRSSATPALRMDLVIPPGPGPTS